MADIAKQLGISRAAVSYALNAQPGVAADTREAVLKLAMELGWHPSASARALMGSDIKVIGLALSRPTETFAVDSFFFEFLAGVESVLVERGWSLLLRVIGDLPEVEVETYRRWWGEGRIDGVILVDERHHDERIAAIEEIGLPAVLCGGPRKGIDLPCIWTDQAGDAALIVEHLAALGHRHIAHVGGPREFVHERGRQRGVRTAAARQGIEVTTIEGTYAPADARAAVDRLVEEPDPPTALIFSNDHTSVAGLQQLRARGKSVPREFSVVSWDDSPLTQAVEPQLTSLFRDNQLYGRQAAETLLSLVAGQHPSLVAVRRSELRERASSGPIG
ncbi:MAG TPA: LacI family DNA-binding transcriptional regulator [Flexivirga sp.]|uniref:LacI family DNA-binding transcriptional regulator n=1 Tax=Flexivirga sp. TaxID=1962927 RepID=UPI002C558D8E|nr:LacI family DNA-binding transcriptional regulator [Flexivirga sp.]HWC23772.1 LacI family DNA-binding transcriptional regulator [Flexivirga sp.]